MTQRHNHDNSVADTYKDLANLIDHTRLRSFPKALEDFLATLCHFDTMLMVTFKKSLKPIILHPTNPAEQSPTLRNYLKKSFILDPLFNKIQTGSIPHVGRLIEIAPDSFETSEYYLSCYRNFDLVDEINLVIELDKSVTCAISLGRKTNLGTITRAELHRLNDAYPTINSLVRQFWLSQSQEYVQYEKSDSAMKQALNTFGSGVLTRREQEISGLILQGHSSKAIANMLNISLGTVKVHRKNIHTRLNTSTQSEIFTLFLAHLNELEAAASGIPQPAMSH
ncbi:LuxR C-terminal-related transcriptional regulator [Neptuniibacter caesariensis]|uniref:Transcriptional regulator, LuxR family protein n=1 Tax=Neptuniibacter caesariensis TaxID=207954 RepID=A0A7U8GR87_NEPCE|nr:LuxR C-terminal-related transcriptional regulator [Neptuniibacter caesariensis]EAR59947.1 transcriptional regulator, LuxR family protein [Oceanospirillum sp. MED92] [Neptuniibacter caesariensis]